MEQIINANLNRREQLLSTIRCAPMEDEEKDSREESVTRFDTSRNAENETTEGLWSDRVNIMSRGRLILAKELDREDRVHVQLKEQVKRVATLQHENQRSQSAIERLKVELNEAKQVTIENGELKNQLRELREQYGARESEMDNRLSQMKDRLAEKSVTEQSLRDALSRMQKDTVEKERRFNIEMTSFGARVASLEASNAQLESSSNQIKYDYRIANEKLRIVQQELAEQQQQHQNEISSMQQNWNFDKVTIQELRQTEREYNEKRRVLEGIIRDTKHEKERIQLENASLLKGKVEHERKINDLNAKLQSLTDRHMEADAKSKLVDTLQQRLEEYENDQIANAKLIQENGVMKTTINKLETKIIELDREKIAIEREKCDLSLHLHKLRTQYEDALSPGSEWQKAIDMQQKMKQENEALGERNEQLQLLLDSLKENELLLQSKLNAQTHTLSVGLNELYRRLNSYLDDNHHHHPNTNAYLHNTFDRSTIIDRLDAIQELINKWNVKHESYRIIERDAVVELKKRDDTISELESTVTLLKVEIEATHENIRDRDDKLSNAQCKIDDNDRLWKTLYSRLYRVATHIHQKLHQYHYENDDFVLTKSSFDQFSDIELFLDAFEVYCNRIAIIMNETVNDKQKALRELEMSNQRVSQCESQLIVERDQLLKAHKDSLQETKNDLETQMTSIVGRYRHRIEQLEMDNQKIVQREMKLRDEYVEYQNESDMKLKRYDEMDSELCTCHNSFNILLGIMLSYRSRFIDLKLQKLFMTARISRLEQNHDALNMLTRVITQTNNNNNDDDGSVSKRAAEALIHRLRACVIVIIAIRRLCVFAGSMIQFGASSSSSMLWSTHKNSDIRLLPNDYVSNSDALCIRNTLLSNPHEIDTILCRYGYDASPSYSHALNVLSRVSPPILGHRHHNGGCMEKRQTIELVKRVVSTLSSRIHQLKSSNASMMTQLSSLQLESNKDKAQLQQFAATIRKDRDIMTFLERRIQELQQESMCMVPVNRYDNVRCELQKARDDLIRMKSELDRLSTDLEIQRVTSTELRQALNCANVELRARQRSIVSLESSISNSTFTQPPTMHTAQHETFSNSLQQSSIGDECSPKASIKISDQHTRSYDNNNSIVVGRDSLWIKSDASPRHSIELDHKTSLSTRDTGPCDGDVKMMHKDDDSELLRQSAASLGDSLTHSLLMNHQQHDEPESGGRHHKQ